MGTLYWQLNDCWPGPSWSGRDYYGRWKALQYYASEAFRPRLVSSVIEEGKLCTYVVSDELKDRKADLILTAVDRQGRQLYRQVLKNITIKANTSRKYYSAD